MPREKNPETKTKEKSYRKTNFKTSNKSLVKVGNAFVISEGYLHKDDIIKNGSATLLGQLRNDGYIKKVGKDGYQTTRKFENDFNNMQGKKHTYGGSNASETHKRAISKTTSLVPDSVLQKGSFKNGQQLIMQHKADKNMGFYKRGINDIKNDISSKRMELEADYKKAMSDSSLSRNDKILIKSNYRNERKDLDFREKVINKGHKGISPPDIMVKMNKNEAREFIQNLTAYKDTLDDMYKEQWERSIERMEEYVKTCARTDVEINIEFLTENYKREQIIAKENYATIYETEVFMFRV